jgi:hypothetical protein
LSSQGLGGNGRHILAAVLVRAIIWCLVVVIVAPVALAASPSTDLRLFGGVQVVPSCSRYPGGSSEFQFVVVNRRPTSVGSVTLDVYFARGTRLFPIPGYQDGQTMFPIVGHHAWKTVQFLNVYSGFALQPIVHGPRSGTRRVVFALTVEGARHTFPAWVCTQR